MPPTPTSTFDTSNRAGTGQSFYLTALGVRVRAPDETGAQFLWSGTSFSAPIISGAVALLAQAFPTLTGSQIVDLLLRTATDLGDNGTDAIYGRGELNLTRAFQPQGQQSIAGTPIPVPVGSTGSLAGPMGDATGAAGPQAVILDSYGRAFQRIFPGPCPQLSSHPNWNPPCRWGPNFIQLPIKMSPSHFLLQNEASALVQIGLTLARKNAFRPAPLPGRS